jgi:Asp-tRNA(Asn)/Glu-tRNA(Gln) amidotransferase A subunit family amidase
MKKQFWIILAIGMLFGFIVAKSTEPLSVSDVQSAQKLINLHFEGAAIDTMMSYLEDNRKAYDSMRTFHLENDIAPALVFDPFPLGFPIKPDKGINPWSVNLEAILPENREDLAFYSIQDLAGLIQTKKISSVELTEIYLERIKKYDPFLLAFVTVTEELAFQQAKKADEELANGMYKGPLHGIPYGVKDLASVPGYPTTWGAYPYKDQVIDETATVVKKLEEAGAVLLGKLVSGSLARGDVWFGGKTKNPWDLEQGASGSSAGSGSATAAGLVAFSIGTETLGSIVSPSTRTGSTGLRPTYGTVSKHGFMVLSWSMDKVGPICRTSTDCAIVFDYIRGQDGLDRTVKDAAFAYQKNPDIKRLKVAYFHELFEKDTSAISINHQRTLQEFEALGIRPEKVALPENFPFSVFDIILRAESGAFFDELVLSGGVDSMVEQHKGSRANSLRQSRFIPAVEYLQANRHRTKLIEEFHAMIKDYDVIISPTFAGRQMMITNLTGHPALSLPNGFDEKGRPTSVTLLGNYFEEEKLIELAEAYQMNYKYHSQVPKGLIGLISPATEQE